MGSRLGDRGRISAIVAAGATAFLLIAVLIPAHDQGPIVRGRPLYQWLQDLSSPGAPKAILAQQVIREFGTNGLPYMLTLRFTEPSRADLLLAQAVALYYPEHQSTADRRKHAASRGLLALGIETANWVSREFERDELIVRETLNPSTEDTHPVNRAAEILLRDLYTNAVPVFHSLLASSNPVVRFHATYALWSKPILEINSSPEVSEPLVRAMLPRLRDPLPENRAMTVLALTCLDPGTEVSRVVNSVGELLADPHSGVRSCATVYLSTFSKDSAHLADKVAEALDRERTSTQSDLPTRERYVRTRTKAEVVRHLERTLRSLHRANGSTTTNALRY